MERAGTLTRRRTVLVVEDDRATSDLLRAVIEGQGLRFVPATEGYQAWTMAIEERPSLITLDLDLPDTDGHAVLHRFLADERTREIPIVVITGYSRYLPDGDGHRIAAVLEKPFDADALGSLLRQILDRSDGTAPG